MSKAKCGPVHTLPRTHLTVMFSLPLRTVRAVVRGTVRETRYGPASVIVVGLLPVQRV